tara:strand:- start:274 stop:864 length:591 start_codon:yes stop_codon:yes gene_type:complete
VELTPDERGIPCFALIDEDADVRIVCGMIHPFPDLDVTRGQFAETLKSRGDAKVQAHASLRFGGPDLDPSEITRLLVLPFDHAHRAGDLRISWTRRGKVQTHSPYALGHWSLSSKGRVSGADLGTHVAWILDQIEPKRAEVAKVLTLGAEGDIFCYWLADHEPNLPKDVRARAESLGLRIDVDRYSITDDPEKTEA